MKALILVRGLCCVALLMGSAHFAYAQEAEQLPPLRKKTITTDPYAATGLSTGGLRLYPSLEIGSVITSNVRRATSNEEADIGLELKPSLRFESNWSRHSWIGSATGDWLHYNKVNDLSTITGALENSFRLDIRHTTHADFIGSYSLNETGIENSQLPNTAVEPRREHNFATSAGVTHDFGGLEGSIKAALTRSIYEDVALSGGGTENNADRNNWAPSLTLRTALTDDGGVFRPFAEIAYTPRFHDQKSDRNGQKRDSQGANISAGVAFRDGPIWDGEMALTYLVRKYADIGLDTAQAFGVTGRLKWSPTELTNVEATSGVTLDETVTVGLAATRNWTAGLNLTQSLRDNLDLKAGLNFALQDASGSYDKTTTAKLGADWKVNPNMTAAVTYQGLWFKSGTAGGDYNDQRLMTSIVLKR